MYGDFYITVNTYEYKRRIDNFLGHEFTEFFRNPGDAAMLKIYEFLAELFEPYVPIDTGALVSSVEVTPRGIMYDEDYFHYVYEGIIYGPNFFVPITQTVDENGDLVWNKEGEWGWRSPAGETKYPTGRYMEYQNPLATRHWDETAISDNEELVRTTIRNIIIEAWKNEH